MERPTSRENAMQQPPILKVLEGAEESALDGEQVLEELAVTLSQLLPRVPCDDPYRGALEALACAAGCHSRGLRAPHVAQ